MRYSVERPVGSDGLLAKRVWVFWLRADYGQTQPTLVLDEVKDLRRATKRHTFKVESSWSRLHERESTMKRPVPPPDVLGEAANQLLASLQFS